MEEPVKKYSYILKIILISLIVLFPYSRAYSSVSQGHFDMNISDHDNLSDGDALVFIYRGFVYEEAGQFDKAISNYSKSIRLNPGFANAYFYRGIAYRKSSRFDLAISDYSRAIELSPGDADAYVSRGIAYRKSGRFDLAISDYSRALELKPGNADVYYYRGIAYRENGQFDMAIFDYSRAIELNPGYADAYYYRGIAYSKNGRFDMTISDYSKAIELRPGDAGLYNNLAWLLATCPDDEYRDGARAIELAEKALNIVEDCTQLDTLAAAYAEAGRFEDAVTTQERAIKLLKIEGSPENVIKRYVERLNFWKKNRPWRENQ